MILGLELFVQVKIHGQGLLEEPREFFQVALH
jgi:hypothetical protein